MVSKRGSERELDLLTLEPNIAVSFCLQALHNSEAVTRLVGSST